MEQLFALLTSPSGLLDVLIDGLTSGSQYALFAAGLSLIFGIMRLVNLAHGDFLILAAFVLLAISWGLGALGLPPELNPIIALVLAAPVLFGLATPSARGAEPHVGQGYSPATVGDVCIVCDHSKWLVWYSHQTLSLLKAVY